MRNFEEWLNTFRYSISDYEYFINFKKVYKNVNKIKVELSILNSLVGEKDVELSFDKLLEKYPEVLKCIPILLAIRNSEIYAMDDDGGYLYNFDKVNLPKEQYKLFMRKTGLFDLISNRIINNLFDYVTGVETGLDTNGRKNRGGHLMENLVEKYIKRSGFIKNETYYKEMCISQITKKWQVDLSNISNKGKSEKRFDYVIDNKNKIYAIETNFYASKGSKLNETARSYKLISEEVNNIPNFEFIWITDGKGWLNARYNLEEAFEAMMHIYNINDLENGIIDKIIL